MTTYTARAWRDSSGAWAIDVRANGAHVGVLSAEHGDDVEATAAEYLHRTYELRKTPHVSVSFTDVLPRPLTGGAET